MIYLSWAALFEGETDRQYFETLIPRVVEELILIHGTIKSEVPAAPAIPISRGDAKKVARQACAAKEAFQIFFVHADTGGRALEAEMAGRSCEICDEMQRQCAWPLARCVVIAPRKETEAWILADGVAVTSALGYTGLPATAGLPADAIEAEALVDPKAVLSAAVKQIRGRRRPPAVNHVFPAIAQRQSLDALRRSRSFRDFESDLHVALADLRCVTHP